MITTAIAPAAARPPASPQLQLSSVAFYGRSFSEYCRVFSFRPADWKGRPVLDVAAGPSSFTADACRAGIDAVAVDPMYGCRPESLAVHVRLDAERMHRQIRAQPALFRLGTGDDSNPRARLVPRFESLAAAERERRTAAQRFLEDYAAHFAHGRYFGAALPHLPFLDGAFDLVLCGHLLFLYDRQFDYGFHLQAVRELVRVARDEVRIHPLCGPDGRPYRHLARLRQDLTGDGIDSGIEKLDHEFFVGANQTLVLTRRSE